MAEPQKFGDALWLNSILKVGCLSETLPVLLDFPHSLQMVLEDFLGTIFYQCILFNQCMPQWLLAVPDGAVCHKCNSKRNAVITETETTLLPIQEVFQTRVEGFVETSVFPQPSLSHTLTGVLRRAKRVRVG